MTILSAVLSRRALPLLVLGCLLVAMGFVATRPLLTQAEGTVAVFQIRSFAPITVPAGAVGAHPPTGLSSTASGKPASNEPPSASAPHQIASVAAVQSAVGFAPILPQTGAIGMPSVIYVAGPRSQKHTFTAAEVDKALTQAHLQAPQVAALLDGTIATLDLPAAAAFGWGDAKKPALVLVELPSPSLTLVGTSAATLRQALFAANGLSAPSEQVAQQLLSISDWQHTLPVPIPPGAESSSVQLSSKIQGLSISGIRDGHPVSGLLWESKNLVFGLAQQGTTYDLASLARSILAQ